MKKIVLLCMISMLFCSCKIIKQIDFSLKGNRMSKKAEEVYNYGEKIHFVLEENAIFIPCKLDGVMQFLHYDSQIGGFLRENISGNMEFPKCEKTIKLRTKTKANHRVLFKIGLKYYDIESDFFHFKNYTGIVTSQSNDTISSKCVLEEKLNRFAIGKDAFPNAQATMLLRFSDTTITLFNPSMSYDTTGFTLVKSMIACHALAVCLIIDSIEYAFLFDTDSKEFISLSQYEKYQKEHDTPIVSSKTQNDGKIIIDTLIRQQIDVATMGDSIAIKGDILFRKKSSQPVVGMKFISCFDWIIDINEEKIYAKQIKR